jgi:hypothetical protein
MPRIEPSPPSGKRNHPAAPGFTLIELDWFATYHGNVGTFAVADGVNFSFGKSVNQPGGPYKYTTTPSTTGTDAAWIVDHWLTPANP